MIGQLYYVRSSDCLTISHLPHTEGKEHRNNRVGWDYGATHLFGGQLSMVVSVLLVSPVCLHAVMNELVEVRVEGLHCALD
jgi:hypothetical protein